MKVSFITITPEAEKLIVYCARVSNPENQDNTETSPRLINYLIKHEHWSPFEMAHMVLEIETSRAISAQILRHRSFSFQEFSQRYSESIGIESVELRKQADKNRQSSEEVFDDGYMRWNTGNTDDKLDDIFETLKDVYSQILKAGASRETARMILPLCTKTRLYMSGSIRSWIHYVQLRTKPDTQKEHRLIAEECKKIFIKQLPMISGALGWNNEILRDNPIRS